jgi:phenylalanyl-tRNA synthetase alpha chain
MIPKTIAEKIGKNLHLRDNHPLNLIKQKIEGYFGKICNCGVATNLRSDHESQCQAAYVSSQWGGIKCFEFYDAFSPMVSTKDNFDDLLIPKDHPSRAPSDTFYSDESTVLRTHTSAHQNQLLKSGKRYFLVTGDVYRRDTVDATHYPIFHQVEGVWIPPKNLWPNPPTWQEADTLQAVEKHLHQTLEGLARHLFGTKIKCRWVDCYFPFTNPSWELEIFFNGDWLEVLGCGLVEPQILKNCNVEGVGWAFGLGLERLAMVLYQIPDIRLFWSDDKRFTSQFEQGKETIFKPFSNQPPVFKDISFWVGDDYHENDFHQLIRDVAGNLVEEVKLFDDFKHPKHGKTNHTYRITYRSMDRVLTNEEINVLQNRVREQVVSLDIELR